MGDVLRIIVSISATDAAVDNKMFGSGNTTLIVSYEEMNDIMKIIKSLEESGLLIKDINKATENEAKGKRRISRNLVRHFMC